jgi:hypothetical protein
VGLAHCSRSDMKQWDRTPVDPETIELGRLYFLAMKPETEYAPLLYASRGLNGKFCWSVKPGIANKYEGSERLKAELQAKPNLIAIAVPPDADKRWRARRHKRLR